MANINFLLGQPLEFKDGIFIYPPKVKDAGNPMFSQYESVLSMSQEDIEDMFEQQIIEDPSFLLPTPYEFLLANSYNSPIYEQIAKQAFYFFTHQQVYFLYEQKLIVIGDIEKQMKEAETIEDFTFLKEEDFLDFQNMVRESIGKNPIDPPDPNMHPKKKRMLALMRKRDRAKAKQAAKKGNTFEDTVVAICCMGFGLNPLNIGELSYCAVGELISTYQRKEKYELDIQSLLAGADSKKVHPKYWIGKSD